MKGGPRILLAAAVAFLATVAVALTVSLAAPGGDSGETPPGTLLPDLDPVAPSELTVRSSQGGRRWQLGFRSATENVGAGPLIIEAGRRSPSRPTMRATQVMRTRAGGRVVRGGAGALRFVRSPDHRHWHLLGFMRYELRTARGHRLVAPDRKSGFCLGDRYDAPGAPAPQPDEAVFTGDCDRDPGALSVREGISVGYGDDYAAHLEGQHVDVTGLPAGRYVLVHRVNADGRLHERSRANNSSSVLISLRRGSGRRPLVRRLRSCPGRERCGP